MKKAIKIGGAVLGVLVLAGLAYLAVLVRSLDTPEFKKSVLDRAQAALGTEVQVTMTGKGVASLLNDSLDYDMTLSMKQAMLDRIPVREMRAAFHPREGGFAAVDFKVTGTMAAPQTDLTSRIGAAAATELVKGGLGKLFGRKK